MNWLSKGDDNISLETDMLMLFGNPDLFQENQLISLFEHVSPSVYRYRPKQGDDDVPRRRMRELAGERKRFSSPRLHIMLKREGLVVNHKRTERIYSEEGLALRRKRRRKGAARVRETIPSPERPNQRWSMDFVSDSTVTGRRFPGIGHSG